MKKCWKIAWAVLILHGFFAEIERSHSNNLSTPGIIISEEDILSNVNDWKNRWEKNITSIAGNHYCERESGEEIGWLISPSLQGFYYGYLATGDVKWIDFLMHCADAWMDRAVTEPDGYLGWPKVGSAGTEVDGLDQFYSDSLVGEAMALRPIVLMAKTIQKDASLNALYGAKAAAYLDRSRDIFEKWDRRGAWRSTEGGGSITVVLPIGLEQSKTGWTQGFDSRNDPGNGFSHPNNKANLVATWLLAMFDATNDPLYKDRAAGWFRLMRSRMTANSDGTYQIWNYWQPAGPWDYKIFGIPKHWIGMHPNPGYYQIDVEAIVDAFEHGVVFTQDDIDRLVATSLKEKRYWPALARYSEAVRKNVARTNDPDSWSGLSETPRFLSLENGARRRDR